MAPVDDAAGASFRPLSFLSLFSSCSAIAPLPESAPKATPETVRPDTVIDLVEEAQAAAVAAATIVVPAPEAVAHVTPALRAKKAASVQPKKSPTPVTKPPVPFEVKPVVSPAAAAASAVPSRSPMPKEDAKV